jgi:hypothetical protein
VVVPDEMETRASPPESGQPLAIVDPLLEKLKRLLSESESADE